MTAEFLAFSRAAAATTCPRRGRNTALPGLQPRAISWCLCAPRWQEAFLAAGRAPRVVLEATHMAALLHCELEDLQRHAT